MKRLFFTLVALLSLTMVAPNAFAQQRRGSGGAGQGRGAGGARMQTRAGDQGANSNGAGVRLRAGNQGQGKMQGGNQGQQASGLLSTNTGGLELLRLREEEKLARDVYTNLAKTSRIPIFRNISRAESQHMQAIERLMSKGGANGNALNNAPGVFTYPEYQQLYDSLVASGSRSPLDALMVGAKIEEMDIADLRRMLSETTDPRVRQTLEHLLQGSENHLRAFAAQIARQGGSYNAEFLSQADYDQIANSSGRGRGQQSGGRGAGNFGQGSQNRGHGGQQFGHQGQNFGGQAFGAQTQSRQGGGRQRRGR